MLGGESLTIGSGAAVNAVLNEISAGREFSGIGMDNSVTLSAVVRLVDWQAAYPLSASSYVGKKASARSTLFRVANVKIGAAFVTVTLEDLSEVQ